MDEPTSALSSKEVTKLFGIVRALKSQDVSIIFVTHRLEEVLELCDNYTVLRDGRQVGSGPIAGTTIDDLIRMMVGRQANALFHHEHHSTARPEVALSIKDLSRRGNARDPHATVLDNVSLFVRKGEILGLAGLVGAGRTELARAIFGADPFASGQIYIDKKLAVIASPQDAIRNGIGLVPEDRKQQALFLSLAIKMNVSMASLSHLKSWELFVDERAEEQMVEEFRRALNIRMAGPRQLVANLSGGNQQKVVLARWLALRPQVLIVDEPTRGIDVGAKVEVHNLLFEMAASGIAIIAISSELPEILAISDRIVTMREGKVTGEIDRAAATQEILLSMMTVGASKAA
jgi:inositol transport system ATP-binding protein